MTDPENKRASARRVTGIGATIFVCSILVIAVPLLIPLGAGAKYLVAIAFIGAIAGLSMMLNGLIDYLRSR